MLQEGTLGDVAPDAEEAQGPSEVKAGPWHHASRGTGTAPGPATRGHQGTPAGRCCPPVALLSITAQSRRGTGGTGCWGGACVIATKWVLAPSFPWPAWAVCGGSDTSAFRTHKNQSEQPGP